MFEVFKRGNTRQTTAVGITWDPIAIETAQYMKLQFDMTAGDEVSVGKEASDLTGAIARGNRVGERMPIALSISEGPLRIGERTHIALPIL